MLNSSFPIVRVSFSDSGLACAAGSLSIEMPFLDVVTGLSGGHASICLFHIGGFRPHVCANAATPPAPPDSGYIKSLVAAVN